VVITSAAAFFSMGLVSMRTKITARARPGGPARNPECK
jgi:hypothetical protein